jgi:carboxylesterase
MTNNLIIQTAEPFFLPGGKTGCLLVHGFTGTPKEMRWMGDYLNKEKGFTVLGVRLSGHATTIKDMMRARWWDWLACVEDGLHLLDNTAEKKVVIGLSMGGALTLLATARYPVQATVCMSAPSHLPSDWRIRFLRQLAWVKKEVDKGAPDWQSEEAANGHVSYKRYPTRSLAELNDLLRETHRAAPKITTPVLLMQGKKDTGIPADSMDTWYREVGSEIKRMVWMPNSGHIITREPDRFTVYDLAAEFINTVS